MNVEGVFRFDQSSEALVLFGVMVVHLSEKLNLRRFGELPMAAAKRPSTEIS